MRKKYLKVIVAIWAFFVSFDQVFAFFASGEGGFNWSSPIPYLAFMLCISALLIFIPGLAKLDTVLVALISVIFGYFVVSSVLVFVQNVPQITGGENAVMLFLTSLMRVLKDVFFSIVPAIFGIVYLVRK